MKSVYDDFYRRYAGRRALSVFIVDNVSEDGQSNFRLVVRPKTERIGKTGPRYWAYVGPFSELLLSRADALNVNKGDEVHCWAIIDPSGTECVDYASDNRPSYYMEKVFGRGEDAATHWHQGPSCLYRRWKQHQARAVRVKTGRTGPVEVNCRPQAWLRRHRTGKARGVGAESLGCGTEEVFQKTCVRETRKEKRKRRGRAAADQDSQPKSHRTEADNAGTSFPTPYGFGPPTRAMDSPAPAGPKGSGNRPVAVILRTISIRSWNNRTLPEI